jgi:predicted ester cyclase
MPLATMETLHMKLLALLTPRAGTTPAQFAPLVVEEERALWPLYTAGVVREMYFQRDPLTVTFIMEAASPDEAQSRLAALPMVARGLLEVRCITLGPWVQLEALFDPRSLGRESAAFTGDASDGAVPAGTDASPEDDAESLVRRFYAAVARGDEDALRALLAPDWEELPAVYPGQPRGVDGYLPAVRAFHAAFPDGVFTLDDVFEAESPGDAGARRVVARTTMRGTHSAPFLDRAATGAAVSFTTIDIHDVVAGRIARSWHLEDFHALAAQLDAAAR